MFFQKVIQKGDRIYHLEETKHIPDETLLLLTLI